ncbi:ImcF-related family protein [Yoonia sediminilitoris]|uniref:Intracellular multiplication and macrophage-killing protein n=1 Tax=Yoonia sediminilitoris TaxID=1286148 RepID=A0A2T6KM51_9RHOB|nr:ImcF-related family protein [Yoonia sediminilitoris]PUB17283.1 intracellular multiplication and macrophage-killing protein [Yoonia sediminilitoris]RCW97578.1 intracellular multiplication and macrophage-killing protein [Yoonia sediminilitoris]
MAGRFAHHAKDFERFIAGITQAETRDLPRLADELGVRLRRFAQACEMQGVSSVQSRPARLALGTLADHAVRTQRSVDLGVWSALARQALFDGRNVTAQDIRDFRQIAHEQGPDFADLAAFLDYCLAQLSGAKPVKAVRSKSGLALIGALVIAVFGLAAYASYLESRFHQQVLGAYTEFESKLRLSGLTQSSDIVTALNALAGDLTHVKDAAAQAPMRGMITLPFADAVAASTDHYHEAVAQTAAPLLAEAISLSLATEGQGLALYDSLRAYGIISGQTAWEPEFLAGWVAAREGTFDLDGFADHVVLLPGPVTDLAPLDPLILDQARGFAAQTNEAERAWLEMLRAPDMVALPSWDAGEAVPLLDQVALRKSGDPLMVPGLYTLQGWQQASDIAAGVAVQKTRALAQPLFGQPLPQQNDTPDLVMARMQKETIVFWQDWLADLRVRPFDNPQTAIIVSGTLAQEWSPLPQLLEQTWEQVGGNDRSRPRPLQTEIGRVFGPAIQYVEQGRMTEIAALFATANVALTTRDIDAARGETAMASVANRARSIQSLRAAPAVVARLVEDTLAQISAGSGAQDNPLTRGWTKVFGQCVRGLTGRYPFGDGGDLPAANLRQLFGPTGAIPLYFKQFAAPNLDMETSPWRWKTEARFAGLDPETAAFFETAMLVDAGLFSGDSLQADMTVGALAERGQATLSLGGQSVPVRANAAAARLVWPGPAPADGIGLRFQGGAASEMLTRPGFWGMLRLLDDLRLRPRDDGQRFLIDMRDDTGRLFVEMDFERAANPVSVRHLMRDFECPERL